jgi:hypothetical protein
MGITLTEDALNTLCAYYSSAPAALAGRPVIHDFLGLHPYLHRTESRVAEWGFEVVISCDGCRQRQTRRVASCAIDIATAVMLGKHEACKPEPPIPEPETLSSTHELNRGFDHHCIAAILHREMIRWGEDGTLRDIKPESA